MSRKSLCDLADLYFIFADNAYEQYLTTDRFKALINFYALLYNRIVIPDTFFINNRHLLTFLNSEEGLEYINADIIVPSVREGINNLTEMYEAFEKNGTLTLNTFSKKESLNILEKISLNKSIKWNSKDIAVNFTENIIENVDSLDIDELDKQTWLGIIDSRKVEKSLTRQELYKTIEGMNFLGPSSKEVISRYIDISYNFNIPNFLQSSAAYPEVLVKNIVQKITPEQIFFNDSFSKKQMKLISMEEYIKTNIFNEGILTALNAEQIIHMRQQKEYENLLKALRRIDAPKNEAYFERSIFDFIYLFDQELPKIVSKEIKDKIEKEKRKLKIQTFGRNTISGDGTSVGIDVLSNTIGLVLEGIQEFIGGKVIGSMVNIVLSPLSKNTEREIKRLEFKGKQIVEGLKTENNIYDIIKHFSINSLKL